MLKLILGLLIICALGLALVNPRVGTRLETVKREGVDLVFALDVSKSMLAEDIRPNRLEKARQIISRTLDKLVSDRVGIIIYAGRAYPQLPITTDYGAARLFLKGVSTDIIPSQGTAIAEAIELATEYYDDQEQKNRVLVLLTDGEDHEEGFLEAARQANDKDIRIISLGIGTKRGAPLPELRNGRQVGYKKNARDEIVISKLEADILRDIASETGGSYRDARSTREAVNHILDTIEKMEKKEFEAQLYADYEDQFQWFLGMALLLLVIDSFILERKTQWFKRFRPF
ncbi:MAG: VWA domain-containing protein [Owenweeksia sp.]|nr:VWA domain-containing protein [Owenweeksia sp.]